MDWFKLKISFFRHRKTRRLCRILESESASLLPLRLWAYCTEAETDNVSKLDDFDLAECLEFKGDPEKLRAALMVSGFLSDDGKTVYGWDEHNGSSQRAYRERAKKGAAGRWNSPASPSESEEEKEEKKRREEGEEIRKHNTSMPEASFKDATSMPQASRPLSNSLSSEDSERIAHEFGITTEGVAEAYRQFYEKKSAFGDNVADPVSAFSGWLRNSKVGKRICHDFTDRSRGFFGDGRTF